MFVANQIIELSEAHPDWDTRQIADALGTTLNYVRHVHGLCDLKIPCLKRGRKKGRTGFKWRPLPERRGWVNQGWWA